MSFSNDNPGLVNQLPYDVELPEDIKGLRNKVNDLYQRIANSVNSKEGGLYVPIEKVTGQQYFDSSNPQKNRNVYRMVVDFGALPNATSKNVAHGISWGSTFRLTRLYGAANDITTPEGLALPNDTILLKINSINVTITTTVDYSAFTESTVVIEYTKG